MYKLNITDEDINIVVNNIDKYIKYIEELTDIKWKIIPDYEDYIISEYGDIISIRSKKILNPFLDKYNYYRINLYKNYIYKSCRIHRLVYSTFIKSINTKDKVYFKDGNRNNCHYSNLSSKFILPKNLINPRSLLQYNNTITKIPKPIGYEALKKIINKYKFDNTKDFIKNLQKDTRLEWRIIPNYNKHIISEYGNIINLEFRNVLKLCLNRYGYYRIGLYINNIYKSFKIHRLVYSTFIDKDIEDFDIHHKDENKINNHYSNLEKINHSIHSKYHHNLKSEKYLKQYKKYYDLKYKKNLSTKEISKKYNVSKGTIETGIQNYKIHLFNNKNINKYNNFDIKEKRNFYSNIILKKDKKDHDKEYLKFCEKIYNLKYKDKLSNKQLAKKYNVSRTTIENCIKDIEIFTFLLDKNFDKFYNLIHKEKRKLRKKMTIINDRNNNILNLGKRIEDLKLFGISNKNIAKELNLSKNRIPNIYKQYKKLIKDNEIKDELKSIKTITD